MAINSWLHKYAYTNFHELNIDYWADEITKISKKVVELETLVLSYRDEIDALKGRATALEGRATTLEDRAEALEGLARSLEYRADALEDRSAALENADIQAATMLSSVGPAAAGASSVEIPFVRDTYENGEKTSGAQSTTIPAATTNTAGVMLPTEKAKMNAFDVDIDGNVAFHGTVSGDDPDAAGDFATKQYVDNIVIAGQASVVYDSDISNGSWNASNVTPDTYTESSGVSARQFGSVTEIAVTKQFTFTTDNINAQQEITYLPIKAGFVPASGFRYQKIMVERVRGQVVDYVPIMLRVNPSNSRLYIDNLRGVSWLTGDTMYLRNENFVYLM